VPNRADPRRRIRRCHPGCVGETDARGTVIMIAHRLSSVRSFDRIVVLQAGQVVQDGPPEQLMRQDGVYRTLIEREMRLLTRQVALSIPVGRSRFQGPDGMPHPRQASGAVCAREYRPFPPAPTLRRIFFKGISHLSPRSTPYLTAAGLVSLCRRNLHQHPLFAWWMGQPGRPRHEGRTCDYHSRKRDDVRRQYWRISRKRPVVQ
jgi:hypothetical protein